MAKQVSMGKRVDLSFWVAYREAREALHEFWCAYYALQAMHRLMDKDRRA